MSDLEDAEIVPQSNDYAKLAQAMIQQGFPNFDTTALCKIMGVDNLPDELQDILDAYTDCKTRDIQRRQSTTHRDTQNHQAAKTTGSAARTQETLSVTQREAKLQNDRIKAVPKNGTTPKM